MKNKIPYITLICTAFCFAMGCIREDRSACPEGASVSFRYILNSDSTDKFNEVVPQISLFVFDSDDLFVEEINKTQSEIEPFANSINIDLPDGLYSFVAVGGYLNHYSIGVGGTTDTRADDSFRMGLVPGESNLSDFRIRAKAIDETEGYLAYRIDDLFMGINEDVKVNYAEVTKSVIDLTLNCNTIKISIEGLDLTNSIPKLISNNGCYNGRNDIEDALDMKYHPISGTQRDNVYTFRNLRLVKGVPIMLIFEDSEGNILPHSNKYDILDFIIQSSPNYEIQEGLDRDEIYEIVFSFEEDVLVSVAIGEWKIIIVKPEV